MQLKFEPEEVIDLDTYPRFMTCSFLPTVTMTAFLFALNYACTTTLAMPYKRNQSVYLYNDDLVSIL